MNAAGQKAVGRGAELHLIVVEHGCEGPSPRLATSTYHPVEVEAEYGCVDWYQYRVQADEKETRH